jgi:ABC-type cobalamin transport system permease subunit
MVDYVTIVVNALFVGVGVAVGGAFVEIWIKPYIKRLHKTTAKLHKVLAKRHSGKNSIIAKNINKRKQQNVIKKVKK